MASLKEIKSRIGSVKSTRQITSAMKMVASAKLHKAEGRIAGMWPYQQKLNLMLARFLRTGNSFRSPYTVERPVRRVALVPFSSNTSLCGAFNSNLVKLVEQRIRTYVPLVGKEAICLFPVGKKVEEAVRKMGYVPQGSYQQMADRPSYAAALELACRLMELYAHGEVDRVELLYYHFKSRGSQVLTQDVYLPIDLDRVTRTVDGEMGGGEAARYECDYIVEPSVPELVAKLIPKVLGQQIYTVLLDNHASEHAARTLAMQTATDNANELMQELTKQYNKTRQQAITNELLDIVGGSFRGG